MNFQLENKQLYCWQWDINQRVIIEGLNDLAIQAPYFLIGNSKDKNGLYRVKPIYKDELVYVDIPDEVLQKEGYADIYLYDEITGTTMLAWRFSIKKKAKPMDYIYEEADILTLVGLMQELEEIKSFIEESMVSDLELLSVMQELDVVNPMCDDAGALYIEDDGVLFIY